MMFVYTSRMGNTDRLVRRVSDKIHPRPLLLRLPWSGTPPGSAQTSPSPSPLEYADGLKDDIVLFTPTYRQTRVSKIGTEYVPQALVSFLDDLTDCSRIKAVVCTGNVTFGKEYGLAGDELSALLSVPLLTRVDLSGSSFDDDRIIQFCQQQIPDGLLK